MRLSAPLFLASAALGLAATCIAPVAARGSWGGGTSYGFGLSVAAGNSPAPRDPREGRIQVTRFHVDGPQAGALGHGSISVAHGTDLSSGTYEAAVIDQLVKAGYDTTQPAASSSQRVELTIDRNELVPQEAPRKPVSGTMGTMISNRGSAVGMGIGVDLTKPRPALIGTRLSAKILDQASGATLWEGRADIATIAGDSRWPEQQIAHRLAGALFDKFPGKSGETISQRR